MKIKIEEQGVNCGVVLVSKDETDTRMGKESTFFYHLAKKLSEVGFCGESHFFRKEMAKDGHYVDNHVFYATNKERSVRVYDNRYAIRDAAKAFNKGETLDLVYDVLA
jgi:hypothetical protein